MNLHSPAASYDFGTFIWATEGKDLALSDPYYLAFAGHIDFETSCKGFYDIGASYAADCARREAEQQAQRIAANPCRCIDCGGDQPKHDPGCTYMAETFGESRKPANPQFCCAICGAGFDFGCRCPDF